MEGCDDNPFTRAASSSHETIKRDFAYPSAEQGLDEESGSHIQVYEDQEDDFPRSPTPSDELYYGNLNAEDVEPEPPFPRGKKETAALRWAPTLYSKFSSPS